MNNEKVVMPANDMPLIAIEYRRQVLCSIGDQDRVATPDFDFMRLLHLPQGKRNRFAGAKDALQDRGDGFSPSVDGFKSNQRFLFRVHAGTFRFFGQGCSNLTRGPTENRVLLATNWLCSRTNYS